MHASSGVFSAANGKTIRLFNPDKEQGKSLLLISFMPFMLFGYTHLGSIADFFVFRSERTKEFNDCHISILLTFG